MPRRKLGRRVEPRHVVSAAAIEEEARWLGREVEDCQLLSATEVTKTIGEQHAKCVQSWEHVRLLLDGLPKRERHAIQLLLFRDFCHILELYVHHIRSMHPPSAVRASHVVHSPKVDSPFNEWLFDP
jgi:hypothetical protein